MRADAELGGSEPLVTICVPTIGRMEYLAEALASVREQTYGRYEILILDNASGSEGQETIAAFAASTPNVRVLRVDERVPQFANFNRGIAPARGKYIAYMHDDDIYAPTFLARHVALLEQYPSAAVAGGNFELIDGAGTLVRRRRLIAKTALWPGRRFIEDLASRGRCVLPTPGLVFRRAAFASEGFDPNVPNNWGDFTVLMRLAESWDVAVLADALFAWRVHGENGSSIPFSDAIPLRTQVLQSFCTEYLARHADDAPFVARLRRRIRRNNAVGLIQGWFTASSDDDAVRCRTLLARDASLPFVATLLSAAERLGLDLRRRRTIVPALRSLSAAIGA